MEEDLRGWFEVNFSPSGIKGRFGARSFFLSFENFSTLPFFSLLILAGREKDEERVKEVIQAYHFPVIREVIAVVNREMDWRAFREFPHLKLVTSTKPEEAIITSLKDGIKPLSQRSQGVILHLANRPPISEKSLETLLKASLEEKGKIVVPLIKGEPSHPIIIPRELALRMLRVRKEVGLPYFSRRWKREIPVD
ncbi:MAG: NTP transferase domain-containing protein [Caldiserica bacterium]|jgi:CTP:molybdopterin cytidylyltransferase MocA|nr:NTP transferase domain-containing protein [Caldisericota bacterium]MDH7562402.1 NTP transferase domain-containing protein [Caldisericota bacterium]